MSSVPQDASSIGNAKATMVLSSNAAGCMREDSVKMAARCALRTRSSLLFTHSGSFGSRDCGRISRQTLRRCGLPHPPCAVRRETAQAPGWAACREGSPRLRQCSRRARWSSTSHIAKGIVRIAPNCHAHTASHRAEVICELRIQRLPDLLQFQITLQQSTPHLPPRLVHERISAAAALRSRAGRRIIRGLLCSSLLRRMRLFGHRGSLLRLLRNT